jgi:hypothetical protein
MKRLLAILVVGAVLAIPHAPGQVPVPLRKLDDGPAASKWPFPVAQGTYKVEFANGVVESCEINEFATASVVEPLRSSTGRLETKGGSIVIAFKDDRTERWTPVGKKYVVEHWFPSAQFPAGTPVLGIAERAE